jgi:hypothetical protein
MTAVKVFSHVLAIPRDMLDADFLGILTERKG